MNRKIFQFIFNHIVDGVIKWQKSIIKAIVSLYGTSRMRNYRLIVRDELVASRNSRELNSLKHKVRLKLHYYSKYNKHISRFFFIAYKYL